MSKYYESCDRSNDWRRMRKAELKPYFSKRVMWECPHTDDCNIANCHHYGPHEFEEDDCDHDEVCSFGIVPLHCTRVGGPKHKETTEGKCIDIW